MEGKASYIYTLPHSEDVLKACLMIAAFDGLKSLYGLPFDLIYNEQN